MESSIVAGDIWNLDLVMDIVLRLPVKSLIRFKCVSKQWLLSLIADPRFCHSHTLIHHHHNFPSSLSLSFREPQEQSYTLSIIPLPISNSDTSPLLVSNLDFLNAPNMILIIRNSCNGLLFVEGINRRNDERCYFACNPITKQFVALSSQILTPATKLHSFFLAFDPLRSPYLKVIAIRREVRTKCYLPESESESESEIFMYSSETGRWNDLGICFMAPTSLVLHTLAGKYLNGCIFWYDYKAESSLYFDVENQCLKTYPMPSNENENGVLYFGESGGHLHMIMTNLCSPISHYVFDIFELKEDYSGWSVRFHVDLTPMTVSFPRWDLYLNEGTKLETPQLLCVIPLEKEEDSMLVFCIKDTIMSYNLVNHSFQPLFKSNRAFLSQVCQYTGNLSWVGASRDY